nr:unnamed protein product [Callosobruchus analis]
MLDFLDFLDRNLEIETRELNNIAEFLQCTEKAKLETGIGIMHFNIRGLNKHFDELLLYLETGKEFLDIIILSETRNIDDINKFQIPNYTGYIMNLLEIFVMALLSM